VSLFAATSPLRRLLRGLAITVFVVLAAPYLVAPFYRVINPVSMLMLWRWVTGAPVERSFVPLTQISPALPIAVIGAEDGSFCSNRGIDLAALREVIAQSDDELAPSRGASTITQQVTKNLFLWNGRSFVRKALELPLALWLNVVLPKRRVLEIYLNIAEWGPNGEFGAEAGARFAFGHSARTLNPREAAEMAAILPNPVVRSARTPSVLVRRLAGIYESRAATYPRLDRCVRPHFPVLAAPPQGSFWRNPAAADAPIPHFRLE
jgi:monofunctional biosynthetic peptidoglycan transglycosylase